MVNILLNINNFGEPFAKKSLRKYIRRGNRVLIIPLSYHEDYIVSANDYSREFSKGSPEIEDIIKEFAKFGIQRKNVRILHYYNDSHEVINNKFEWADILFFTGGYPDQALRRIDELNIRDKIKSFRGVVIGTSAGAMIQLDKFHSTPESEDDEYRYYTNGLGLISGFDIEVHYHDDATHIGSMICDLKAHGTPIYAMYNSSGMIIKKNGIVLLGDVFPVGVEDINELEFCLSEYQTSQRIEDGVVYD